MAERRPLWELPMFGRQYGFRAEREEKVLRYIIHRVDADAELHDVLQEPTCAVTAPKGRSTTSS